MSTNFKELYEKVDFEVLKEKLKELFENVVGTQRTSYYQSLVLHDDGSLEVHRLGQNESLKAEFNGEAYTLYREQEFDITDIEGWTEDDVDIYIKEEFNDWFDAAVERIEDDLERCDEGWTEDDLKFLDNMANKEY